MHNASGKYIVARVCVVYRYRYARMRAFSVFFGKYGRTIKIMLYYHNSTSIFENYELVLTSTTYILHFTTYWFIDCYVHLFEVVEQCDMKKDVVFQSSVFCFR